MCLAGCEFFGADAEEAKAIEDSVLYITLPFVANFVNVTCYLPCINVSVSS